MIARNFRFRGYGGVRFVLRKGSVVRSKAISLKYYKNKNPNNQRIAVVVSKKISKIAPKRNRIRRRIYEAMRRKLQSIQPGFDLVLTVFDDSFLTISNDELDDRLQFLLKQANLIKHANVQKKSQQITDVVS